MFVYRCTRNFRVRLSLVTNIILSVLRLFKSYILMQDWRRFPNKWRFENTLQYVTLPPLPWAVTQKLGNIYFFPRVVYILQNFSFQLTFTYESTKQVNVKPVEPLHQAFIFSPVKVPESRGSAQLMQLPLASLH